MRFFESIVLLLLAAIVLLQVARRLSLPYPAMLALAGLALGMVPGAPAIQLDPQTALALFIAPVLVDAAFDFPVGAVWKLWRPLIALAAVAVVLTAGAVTLLGTQVAGLPVYAALALGAIVAPPDAAAATAVLGNVSMPRRAVALLKGESLLNDATALLLFSIAVTLQTQGGVDTKSAVQFGLAAPGGVLLGVALAAVYRRLGQFVAGTLGGNLLEFVTTFAVWILAERLHLSAVLCMVAFAMTIARGADLRQAPRVRLHSFAVWETVVFLVNVVAFLLMGLQARTIVGSMSPDRLRDALAFAALVTLCTIGVRLAWVMGYNLLSARVRRLRGDLEPTGPGEGFLIGWCGMRGLVTMATALALPGDFPQRDLMLLTAFTVVLGTLVVQGLTLAPLIRWLKLDGDDGLRDELDDARVALADAGMDALADARGPEADYLRYGLRVGRDAAEDDARAEPLETKRSLALAMLRRQRERLRALRQDSHIGQDAFETLQEELDFRELAFTTEDERRIEES